MTGAGLSVLPALKAPEFAATLSNRCVPKALLPHVSPKVREDPFYLPISNQDQAQREPVFAPKVANDRHGLGLPTVPMLVCFSVSSSKTASTLPIFN